MKNYNYRPFNLSLKKNKEGFRLRLFSKVINTKNLPHTKKLLNILLPEIMVSECFNPQDIPFSEEVKNTEIGHLFEHILLEYMCRTKEEEGGVNFCFEGETSWNWDKQPVGTYDIDITYREKDNKVFEIALQKALALLGIILGQKTLNQSESWSGINYFGASYGVFAKSE